MSTNYSVIVEPFAERHFIKGFAKKYKSAWDITWRAVTEEIKRVESLFETSVAETISDKDGIRIVKMEFRVAGTQESRHASGNRIILAVDSDRMVVRVLVVYNKNDFAGGTETAQWKNMVRENYPEYSGHC